MKVFYEIHGGGSSTVSLIFKCWECCEALIEHDNTVLRHPAYEQKFLGGDNKNKPLTCKHAGKLCERPSLNLVELP